MFSRVITANVPPNGLDAVECIARQQLGAVGDEPGFGGFYLLAEGQAGKVLTISLWEQRERGAAHLTGTGPGTCTNRMRADSTIAIE